VFKRAELLLRLAEIRQSLGDLAGTRQVAIEAAELARTTGSAEQLARCAFLLTRQGAIGLPDPEARQFGEEALASLPEEARTLRATVMAGLARYQAWDESKGAGVDLGRQALQLARDSGDRRTLSDVLSVVLFTLYGTARMDEIIDLSDEMIALAETISDPSSRSDALAARALARLALGEQEGFKSDRLELERFAAQYRLRLKSAIAASLKVIEALAAGRFDEAESDSRTMLDSGEDDPNIVNLSLGHNVVLARERGLYDRLLPRLAALPETRPGMVGLATGVSSLFYAELRDHVAARDCLDRMLLDDMALVPTDAARSVILCCAAESAARLGATDYAAPIRNALAPWAGQITFTGRSVAWGAADRFLAMLAALGRDFDAAESLYRSAIALEDRLDAPPFLARTRWWYAEMLMSRDGEGDRKLASDLLDQAISTASSLNMPVLLVEAEELRSKA
jgi:tetratricopeptide (TPR) repeat protein